LPVQGFNVINGDDPVPLLPEETIQSGLLDSRTSLVS
jgi:hypothetical protein